MDDLKAIKLQAYLDGELTGTEAAEAAKWLAGDPAARALATELENTIAAVRGIGPELKLPESREFYWSKISREIERTAAVAAPAAAVLWWRRLLVPAGALAIAAAVLIPLAAHYRQAAEPPLAAGTHSSTYSFYSEEGNVTVVWVHANEGGTANGN